MPEDDDYYSEVDDDDDDDDYDEDYMNEPIPTDEDLNAEWDGD